MTEHEERDGRPDFEQEQEDAAAAEAGAIGGRVTDNPTEAELEMDEAERPVMEAGGGESEGQELAEAELEEHASHGDEHAARRIIEDADLLDEGESERL
jgi:hypothetical protein